jgi:hypothetical protein
MFLPTSRLLWRQQTRQHGPTSSRLRELAAALIPRVPLYVEQSSSESVAEAVKRAEFDEVWEVLQALQDQDDVLADAIRTVRINGTPLAFLDIVEVRGLQIPIEKLRRSISSRGAEVLGTWWDEYFGRIQAYRKIMGHCCVKGADCGKAKRLAGDAPPANLQFNRDFFLDLASWVRQQRWQRGRNKLTAERIRLLDDLGFTWNPQEANQKREEAAWHRKLVSLDASVHRSSIPDDSCQHPAEKRN